MRGRVRAGDFGDTLMFDGSVSSDPDGTIVRFDWDFGDGTGLMMDAGPTPSHTFDALAGLLTVTLTVTDDDGVSVMCTTTADINLPPNCVMGLPSPPTANVGGADCVRRKRVDGSGRVDCQLRLGLR